MAECNTCGGYLSIEDKIRLSMKCDANGNVVWQGALLNPLSQFNIDINLVGANRALSPLEIPTYVGDADKGAVHPDVWDFGYAWNGYRYWMVFTPLPTVDPDANENPSIVVSNDLQTWVVPPGLTNPIYPKGATSYQSDPDLLFDDGKLYIIWRGRDALNNIVMYYGYSTDGITWTARTLITFAAGINTNFQVVSPSIVKEDSGYSMYTVDQTGAVDAFNVKRYISPTIGGEWTLDAIITTDYALTGLPNPATMGNAAWYHWHINVNKINGIYYMISYIRSATNAYTKMYLLTSSDGLTFKMGKYALHGCHSSVPANTLWDAGGYRCAIVPFVENGESKFHFIYGGRYNDCYNGYPVRIGYSKIEIPDTYIQVDETINSVKSVRATELIAANAHEGNYIYADDFSRTLETVNGLGTSSDGHVYAVDSVNYWRVGNGYAYINSNTRSYFRKDLTLNYDVSTTMLSSTRLFYCKYIDENNRIMISGYPATIIQLVKAGSFITKVSTSPRYIPTHINHYRIVCNGYLLILYVNGIEELRYTFKLSDFDSQSQMDSFFNSTVFRVAISATGEKIYDITAKSL